MSAAEFDLDRLLRPLGSAAFFAQHWEREPLLLRRADSSFYDALLRLADIEAFIARGDARYPAIRLAKGGGFYPPEAYTLDFKFGDEVFRGMPDVEKIHSQYSSGATITLPAWHRAWPPLGALCARLEAQLDHAVNTNVYLTPARAAGFTPHYDTHEVFVLQIAGRKHWRIYPPPLMLPHRSQTFAVDRYVVPSRPLLELELAAGDLLYLPRGYVHTTTTSEQSSAHVTIGVTVYTWVEMLLELIQQSVEDPEFRQGLPPGFTRSEQARAQLPQRLGELLSRLPQSVDLEELSRHFLERVVRARPRAPISFQTDTGVIGPKSRLRVASAMNHSILEEQGDLILVLSGRRVHLPLAVGPTLKAMGRLQSFTPEALPGDISLEARLTLLRYLHGLGFVQTVEDDRSPPQ
jgi:ribosomal protein L16 Arg81 hydroxylase